MNRVPISLIIFMVAVFSAASWSQHAVPLSIDDALRTYSFGAISPLALSPDGKYVAYMVQDNERVSPIGEERFLRTGVPPEDLWGELWVSSVETGETKRLTSGKHSSWEPTWSPDGTSLAFLSDQGKTGQAELWIWSPVRDELKAVSNVPIRTELASPRIEWTPDSKQILITILPVALTLEEYVNRMSSPVPTAHAPAETQPGATVLLYESAVSRLGHKPALPMSNLDTYNLHDLVLIEIESGKISSLVRNERVDRYGLSSDGTRVVYAIPTGFEKPGSWRRVYDIVTIDIATLKRRLVASDVVLLSDFSWSPDSTHFAYVALGGDKASYDCVSVAVSDGTARSIRMPQGGVSYRASELMWNANGDSLFLSLRGALWRISLATGTAAEVGRVPHRRIMATLSYRPGLLWTGDGGRSTVVLTHDDEGKQDGFYQMDLISGDSSQLLERGECYTCKWPVAGVAPYLTAVSSDGQYIAYIAEDAQHPPQLWVSDASFSAARQLTHLNPQFDRYSMGKAELIDWLSDDGKPLRGALLLPAGYRAGKRYPLVVWVHPAQQSNHFDKFGMGEFPGPLNMQLFATRGYAVFLPDIPEPDATGSLPKAVLPGVSKVVSLGIADPERIGVIGHSAGGFSVLELLTETTRFKAGVSLSGSADYLAIYSHMQRDGSDYQYGAVERILGGQPWQNPLKYVQNSPVYYLDQIKAPLLIAHGSEDSAVSSFLADEEFVGLRRLGKRVEYAKYEGENHVPREWSYANQYDLATRVLRWFATYLGN